MTATLLPSNPPAHLVHVSVGVRRLVAAVLIVVLALVLAASAMAGRGPEPTPGPPPGAATPNASVPHQ